MDLLHRHLERHHARWFWAIFVLAVLIRVPLLFNHFSHCDDSPSPRTYPPFQHVIEFTQIKLATAVERFTSWSPHLVARSYTRSVGLVLSLLGIVTSRVVLLRLFPARPLLAMGLPVLGCMSQMHIIYSVHASPYGQMLLCFNAIILCFLYCCRQSLSLGQAFIVAVILSLTVQLGYTSIFVYPAFFGGLLLSSEVRRRRGFWKTYLVMLVVTVCHLLYVVALFLRTVRHRGTNWNAGANDEFVFLDEGPLSAVGFLLGNLAVVIENHLAPYGAIPFTNIGFARLLLGCLVLPPLFLGAWLLFKERREMFWFMAIALGTLVVLGCRNIVPLSPTRHTLGYVAMFLVLYAAAIESTARFGPRWPAALAVGGGGLACLVCLVAWPGFYFARRDRLPAAELATVIDEYEVDFVLPYDSTDHVLEFPGVGQQRSRRRLAELDAAGSLPAGEIVILLVSHRRPPRPLEIEFPRYAALWKTAKPLFRESVGSTTEVGRSNWVRNGTNGRYLTVVRCRPDKHPPRPGGFVGLRHD